MHFVYDAQISYVMMLSLSFRSSLATAGYGTALGVIRALHSGGVLEKAFCTETRPFNQVDIPLHRLSWEFRLVIFFVINLELNCSHVDLWHGFK